MIVKKIILGFVIQDFDTEIGKFVRQDFIAGNTISYEDEMGEEVKPQGADHKFLSLDMVQP
jgi:hypothetical protein